MTWSGFRPSDDACTYHYLVPANMFAVVVMGYLERIFTEILDDADIAARARALRTSIDEGLRAHGTMRNAAGETIWAYEVDGLGNALLMDDSNVPSLMAARTWATATPTTRSTSAPAARCSAPRTRSITRASTPAASAPRTPRRATCGPSRCRCRA